ncbi:MAG: Rab family GTPase [Candidatus Hodarchaeota archaeon]
MSSRVPDEEKRFTAVYKLVTLGEAAVGKTSLVTKYVTGKFERDYRRTLGIDISTYDAQLDKGFFKLLIWDLAGQDIFRDLRTRYCQGASGGILVFDLTRPQTLTTVPQWVEAFREAVGPEPVLMLLGNKADLDKQRKISKEEGQKVAEELGLYSYKETSAKTGHQVSLAFNELAELMYEQHMKR